MLRRRLILTSLALLTSLSAAPLWAESGIFFSKGGIAINGYDPVAYFTVGRPVKGQRQYAVMWKGAIWQFANRTNREKFEANPWAYAPQYGGYCAYGMAMGYRDSTAPEAWKIVNGKLYLVHTPEIRSVWVRNLDGHISRANANWPQVLSH